MTKFIRKAKYALIAWWLNKSEVTNYCDEQGYREAVGGRWGLWEVKSRDEVMCLWLRSSCEHYPIPPSATHTEPLAVEEYP